MKPLSFDLSLSCSIECLSFGQEHFLTYFLMLGYGIPIELSLTAFTALYQLTLISILLNIPILLLLRLISVGSAISTAIIFHRLLLFQLPLDQLLKVYFFCGNGHLFDLVAVLLYNWTFRQWPLHYSSFLRFSYLFRRCLVVIRLISHFLARILCAIRLWFDRLVIL